MKVLTSPHFQTALRC